MPLRLVNGKLVNESGEPAETDDVTPITGASSDELRCEECGTPLVYSGRGRYPRFCDEHKPVSPSRSRTGSTSPRRSSTLRNEAALRESLTARYLMLSNIASLRHPAYAASIRDKIERAVEADIAYAKVNPSFRRVLEGALEKTAAAEVIAVHVSMFAPVIVGEAANRGRKKATEPRGEARQRPADAPRSTPPASPPQPPSPGTPPQPPTRNVTHLFPAEHEGAGDGETTEYESMPDADTMPGV